MGEGEIARERNSIVRERASAFSLGEKVASEGEPDEGTRGRDELGKLGVVTSVA
jgi:hypothetical protein